MRVEGSLLLGAQSGFEATGAAGLKALVRGTLQLYLLDASRLAELALGSAAALGIDDEDVGLHEVERGDEVDDATALVDVGFLHGLDVLYHEQAFLLGEHGLAVLVLQVGGIGANAYIEVTELGGLLEELHVAAMQEVVTARNKNLFHLLFTDLRCIIWSLRGDDIIITQKARKSQSMLAALAWTSGWLHNAHEEHG